MEKETKLCNSCFLEKPLNTFRKNSGLTSYRSQCNKCLSDGVKVPLKEIRKEGFKVCIGCSIEKEYKDFPKNCKGYGEGGVQKECKKCRSIKEKKNTLFCKICRIEKYKRCFNKNSECCIKCSNIKIEIIIPKTIVCNTCNIEKLICEYPVDKNKKYGCRNRCKNCTTEKYYEKIEVKKEILAEGLKRCSKCKDVKKESYFTKEGKGLRASCKKCQTKYIKNRRNNDELFKAKERIRRIIYRCFREKRITKKEITLNILGCTFEEFKKHIESQFLNWMSWDNYGNVCEALEPNCSWDLDHIIPISVAKTENEIYLLNHWSNFQPLCSKINRREKKNKISCCTNIELKITIETDYNLKTLEEYEQNTNIN